MSVSDESLGTSDSQATAMSVRGAITLFGSQPQPCSRGNSRLVGNGAVYSGILLLGSQWSLLMCIGS